MANSRDRRTLRRLLKEAGQWPPPTPQPEKIKEKENKKPKVPLLKIISAMAALIGVIGALTTFLPRVTATVSDPVDPENPFSASVTITNTGSVPLSSVRVLYGLKKMTFGDPAKPITMQNGGSGSYAMLGNANWHPSDLGLDEKFTFGLNEIMGKQSTLASADIAIVIEYKTPIIPWRREKTFPLTAVRQSNGNFYWYAKAQ